MRGAPLLAIFLLGCFGEAETAFPPGLEPLEAENMAPAPEPIDGDPYPEAITMVRSFATDVDARTPEVHARAYVHAPITQVWEILRNPDVDADRRVLASWSVLATDVEPEYDFSYILHHVIINVITVEYDMTWRHAAVLGSVEAPELVAIRFQKTDGSTVIEDLRASIVMRPITSDVTELEIIELLRAVGSSHANIESFLNDFFASIVALAHGQPLPTL
jgi:hypothetical protein